MDPRSLTKEFKEFLQLLNDHGVEYLLIGGHAVAFHGYPRATNDLDVWVAVSQANTDRLIAALIEFGFDETSLPRDEFLRDDRVLRFGVAPNRIEIQTGIDGIQFAECYCRGITAEIDGLQVPLIALEDLKTNKRASGRNKDLADLDNLP